MSRKELILKLTDEDLNKIENDLQIEINNDNASSSYNKKYKNLYLFEQLDNYISVPFSYNINFPRTERKILPSMKVKFEAELRDNQKDVKNEAIKYLNDFGSVIISAACGFGKTALSISLATVIKLKTLILCNRIVLIKQWKESILKFCPSAKIQIIDSKNEIDDDMDFYIMNAANVYKYSIEYFKNIGTVICDELHIIMAEKISNCMKFLFPRYLIGLSATPYRSDGFDKLISLYFGENKIIRKLYREHIIYKYVTEYKPDVKLNSLGKVDWNSVIESISNNEERNKDIINIVKMFKDRNFLIPCKRVSQAEYLYQKFKEEGEYVTSLIGNKQEYDSNARILIGTVQKCSVGFDHPGLNAMIIASDVEQYFEQYLGRVFRTETVIPIIFDIVDNFGLLYKHYKSRESVYIEHGGKIKNFLKEFPKFK